MIVLSAAVTEGDFNYDAYIFTWRNCSNLLFQSIFIKSLWIGL